MADSYRISLPYCRASDVVSKSKVGHLNVICEKPNVLHPQQIVRMNALNDVFSLLTKERRRFVLYYLKDVDGGVSLDELAKKVYEWEENILGYDVPEEEYREVKIALAHNDIPKIEKAEQIEFVQTHQELRITGMSSEAEVILSVSEAIETTPDVNDIVDNLKDRSLG